MSLTTLSTPHHGSALADYVRDARGASARNSQAPWRVRFYRYLAGDYDRGRRNLTTSHVKAFNKENLPLPQAFFVDDEETGVNYFSYGADANLNDSMDGKGRPTISRDEMAGTGWRGTIPVASAYGGQLMYRTLYYVSKTYWRHDGQGRKIVLEVPNPNVEPDDLLVTETSSKLQGHFLARPDLKRNHATVADAGVGQLVLGVIRSIQPMSQ